VEIVRRGYEPFAELGRFDFEFFDPKIKWRGPRELPDSAEPHFGHEGVKRHAAKVKNEAAWPPRSPSTRARIRCSWFSREGGRGTGSGAEVQGAETKSRTHRTSLSLGRRPEGVGESNADLSAI